MPSLGLNAVAVENDGTFGTPDWTNAALIYDIIKDVTLNISTEEADVTTRGGNGWKQSLATLKDASVEISGVWENGDTNFASLMSAFLNNTTLDLGFFDGPATTGAQGLHAEFVVTELSRNEEVSGALTFSATLKPGGTNAPEWLTI